MDAGDIQGSLIEPRRFLLGTLFFLLLSFIIFHPSTVGWRMIVYGWWHLTGLLLVPQIGLVGLAYNFYRKENMLFARALTIFVLAIQILGLESILQYRTAGWNPNLYTDYIVAADKFLLFDWIYCTNLTLRVPNVFIENLYMSFTWMEVIGLIWLAFVNFPNAQRYLMATTLTLLITLIVFGLVPVMDAASTYHFNYYTGALDGAFQSNWAVELVSTQSGVPHFQYFTPLVSFPSFHAAGLTLLCWYFRHEKLRSCAWLWAFLVLLTLPARGFHYLTDIVAGIAVAMVSIAIVDFCLGVPIGKREAAIVRV